MKEFKTQQDVWLHLAQGGKVQCCETKHVYGFKNGELWDFTRDVYCELYFYNAKDWSDFDTHFTVGSVVAINGEVGKVTAVEEDNVLVAFNCGIMERFDLDGIPRHALIKNAVLRKIDEVQNG